MNWHVGFFHQLNNSELLKEDPVAWDQNYFHGAIMYLQHGSQLNDIENCSSIL
jgi:hypothetical protein